MKTIEISKEQAMIIFMHINSKQAWYLKDLKNSILEDHQVASNEDYVKLISKWIGETAKEWEALQDLKEKCWQIVLGSFETK